MATTLRRVAAGIGLIALFLVTYLTVNFVHFRYFRVRVVAYDALLDVALAAALVGVAWFVVRRHLATTAFESVLFLTIGALLSAIYAIMVPTVIDRSLSVYILEKLDQRGGAIRADAFEDILVREFFPEHQLVAIRLTEQVNSGTVTLEDGCVRLTLRGRRIAYWTRFYRTTLLPRHREILGRFTDDLTDPFRRSEALAPFRCE
jgi:small basic protein